MYKLNCSADYAAQFMPGFSDPGLGKSTITFSALRSLWMRPLACLQENTQAGVVPGMATL